MSCTSGLDQPDVQLATEVEGHPHPKYNTPMPFHLYILRCSDGSYYTGHTENLESRLAAPPFRTNPRLHPNPPPRHPRLHPAIPHPPRSPRRRKTDQRLDPRQKRSPYLRQLAIPLPLVQKPTPPSPNPDRPTHPTFPPRANPRPPSTPRSSWTKRPLAHHRLPSLSPVRPERREQVVHSADQGRMCNLLPKSKDLRVPVTRHLPTPPLLVPPPSMLELRGPAGVRYFFASASSRSVPIAPRRPEPASPPQAKGRHTLGSPTAHLILHQWSASWLVSRTSTKIYAYLPFKRATFMLWKPLRASMSARHTGEGR